MTTPDLCPCGSQQIYASCCGPLLDGQRLATTAEALMRSRYSAHVLARQQPAMLDYLMATWAPEQRGLIDRDAVANWAVNTEWLGLTVLAHQSDPVDAAHTKAVQTEAAPMQTVTSQTATVEFIARYRQHNTDYSHHELSFFRRDGEHWYFVHGEEPPSAQTTSKPGRNDPCRCGSGKKYKRCCAL